MIKQTTRTAELEQGLRRERQALGIASAKKRGVRFGRPPNEAATTEMIVSLRARGMGINKIAKRLRVGSGTVSKVLTMVSGQIPTN
jgi:DNA invertase Pin-like site-specific DNA recombinase